MTAIQKAERRFERVDRDLHKLAGLLENVLLEDEALKLDNAADAIQAVHERLEDLKHASTRLFSNVQPKHRKRQAGRDLQPETA